MKFKDFKDEILKRAKETKAFEGEYLRAENSRSYKELFIVIGNKSR